MEVMEIAGRLDELDGIMERYERANAYRCKAYEDYSEEYANLTNKLEEMGWKRSMITGRIYKAN